VSKFVLLNARIFAGAVDLTSNSNKVELSEEREDKETTSFGSAGWKEVLAGLASTTLNASGQWEANDATKVDDDQFANFGTLGGWSVIPAASSATVVAGDLAWLVKALRCKYVIGDQVGNVAPWSGENKGTSPLVRGSVLHPPGTARTTTGSGTAIQIGAVTAGKSLYAALHVYSISGSATPTITVKVQSDDNSGMTTPTDRITFTAATAVGGQYSSVAGAVTDDWWRITWTISGTTPSFLLVATAGIA
jgi:hypothetical protein